MRIKEKLGKVGLAVVTLVALACGSESTEEGTQAALDRVRPNIPCGILFDTFPGHGSATHPKNTGPWAEPSWKLKNNGASTVYINSHSCLVTGKVLNCTDTSALGDSLTPGQQVDGDASYNTAHDPGTGTVKLSVVFAAPCGTRTSVPFNVTVTN